MSCSPTTNHFGDTTGNPCAQTSGSTITYTTPTLNDAKSGPGNSFCAAWQGTQIDNYQLARNHNITLRLDELTSAVCCSSDSLMYTANAARNSSPNAIPPVYQFAVYSMDTLWSVPGTTPGADANNNLVMGLTSDYMTAWKAASANFGVINMYENNYLCATAACDAGIQVAGQGDLTTNYDVALSSINATMPDPGNGSNVSGDSPQEVLFFVTDGVEDDVVRRHALYSTDQRVVARYELLHHDEEPRHQNCRSLHDLSGVAQPTTITSKKSRRSRSISLRPCRPARRRACSIKPRSATTLERT